LTKDFTRLKSKSNVLENRGGAAFLNSVRRRILNKKNNRYGYAVSLFFYRI